VRRVTQIYTATALSLDLVIEIVDFDVCRKFKRSYDSAIHDQFDKPLTACYRFFTSLVVKLNGVPCQTATARRNYTTVCNGEWSLRSEGHFAMHFDGTRSGHPYVFVPR